MGWISGTMWKAFRVSSIFKMNLFGLLVEVGLLPADLFRLAGPDQGRFNAARFERLWGEERESCNQWNRQHADTQAAVSQSQYRTESCTLLVTDIYICS